MVHRLSFYHQQVVILRANNINEKVDVLYIPEYPNEAKIKSFFSLWGGATILGTLGLVFFIIGGSIIAYNMTKKNTREYLKLNGIK